MVGGRARAALGGLVAIALLLAGCAAGPSLGDAGIVVGTALPVTSLDPAGAAGEGGELVAEQVYPHLLTVPPGGDSVVPDIAQTAAFDASGAYVVTLKPGLAFANGDPLQARDVVASLTRQTAIRAHGGPWPLLAGIASMTAKDARTVVFTLTTPGDQDFPAVLASPAAAIVDPHVFPAKGLARDADIVRGQPFAGPYTLQSQNPGDLLTFHRNPGYGGRLGAPRSPDVTLKLYADARNLTADAASGAIDLAYGGLGMRDLRTLRGAPDVRLTSEPGGALHSLVFDLATMPYGTSQDGGGDPVKAQAVRTACADLVDRSALAAAGSGMAAPVWGFVPDHLAGASTAVRDVTGDLHGGPDSAAARAALMAAQVDIPVSLTIAVPDDLDVATAAEYTALKTQLETGELLSVDLQKVPARQFESKRGTGAYPAYAGGWTPDGLDPVTYRAPYLVADAQLGSHYTDPTGVALMAKVGGDADRTARAADLELLQRQLAVDLPVLPLLQERQLAAGASGVTGVRFDGSYTLRFGSLRAR
jgi:peptide/nickel transport system substrate-binding protein